MVIIYLLIASICIDVDGRSDGALTTSVVLLPVAVVATDTA